jgi:hypothetical protein
MKHSFFIIISILACSVSYGQNETNTFEASKGTWGFPITNVQHADTMMRDCLWGQTSSPNLLLKTTSSEEVRAIHYGIVRSVAEVSGTYAVLVKTGDYYLMYVGLIKPSVKKGDTLQRGSVIGNLAKGNYDTFDLQLMLFKDGPDALNINRWFNWKTAHNTSLLP